MPYVPFRADPYISYNGLKLLLNLSFSPLVRKQIAELDGVKNVVAFLPNTRTRTAAIKVLYNLSTDGSCRESFAASDCLTSVIKLCLMNKNPQVSFWNFWSSRDMVCNIVGCPADRHLRCFQLCLVLWCPFSSGFADTRAAWKSLCELVAGPTERAQGVQQQGPCSTHEEVSRDKRYFPCKVCQNLVLVHVSSARSSRGGGRL